MTSTTRQIGAPRRPASPVPGSFFHCHLPLTGSPRPRYHGCHAMRHQWFTRAAPGRPPPAEPGDGQSNQNAPTGICGCLCFQKQTDNQNPARRARAALPCRSAHQPGRHRISWPKGSTTSRTASASRFAPRMVRPSARPGWSRSESGRRRPLRAQRDFRLATRHGMLDGNENATGIVGAVHVAVGDTVKVGDVEVKQLSGSPCSDSDLGLGGIDAAPRPFPPRIPGEPIPC